MITVSLGTPRSGTPYSPTNQASPAAGLTSPVTVGSRQNVFVPITSLHRQPTHPSPGPPPHFTTTFQQTSVVRLVISNLVFLLFNNLLWF